MNCTLPSSHTQTYIAVCVMSMMLWLLWFGLTASLICFRSSCFEDLVYDLAKPGDSCPIGFANVFMPLSLFLSFLSLSPLYLMCAANACAAVTPFKSVGHASKTIALAINEALPRLLLQDVKLPSRLSIFFFFSSLLSLSLSREGEGKNQENTCFLHGASERASASRITAQLEMLFRVLEK